MVDTVTIYIHVIDKCMLLLANNNISFQTKL